jgi:internalin A
MSLPQKVSISRNKFVFALVSMLIGPFLSFTASAQDVFPDKALEAAVRWEVFEKRYNDQPITADDVKNISQVVGRGKGIKNLEGLQHCKVIMKIDLANNEIADLTPIANLKQVQFLDLSGNKVESIAPVAGLTQMQYFQLSKNQISDLAPIKDMVKMNSLYLNENKIKSVEPVAGLKKLWTLQLGGNPLEALPDLPELKGVETLNLKGCGLKKLDFIKDFKNLRLLMLDENPLETLAPLIESCEADTSRRFAPFLRLYVDAKQIESLGPEIERLRKVGVRINPETK